MNHDLTTRRADPRNPRENLEVLQMTAEEGGEELLPLSRGVPGAFMS